MSHEFKARLDVEEYLIISIPGPFLQLDDLLPDLVLLLTRDLVDAVEATSSLRDEEHRAQLLTFLDYDITDIIE